MIKELEVYIGGIKYLVEIDLDEECVVGVFSVAVWNGKKHIDIPMTSNELERFFERYEDELNEAWINERTASEILALEERGKD